MEMVELVISTLDSLLLWEPVDYFVRAEIAVHSSKNTGKVLFDINVQAPKITPVRTKVVAISVSLENVLWEQDFRGRLRENETMVYWVNSHTTSNGEYTFVSTRFNHEGEQTNKWDSYRCYVLDSTGTVLYEYTGMLPIHDTININADTDIIEFRGQLGLYQGYIEIHLSDGW